MFRRRVTGPQACRFTCEVGASFMDNDSKSLSFGVSVRQTRLFIFTESIRFEVQHETNPKTANTKPQTPTDTRSRLSSVDGVSRCRNGECGDKLAKSDLRHKCSTPLSTTLRNCCSKPHKFQQVRHVPRMEHEWNQCRHYHSRAPSEVVGAKSRSARSWPEPSELEDYA